jgi:hypothetical protein
LLLQLLCCDGVQLKVGVLLEELLHLAHVLVLLNTAGSAGQHSNGWIHGLDT